VLREQETNPDPDLAAGVSVEEAIALREGQGSKRGKSGVDSRTVSVLLS